MATQITAEKFLHVSGEVSRVYLHLMEVLIKQILHVLLISQGQFRPLNPLMHGSGRRACRPSLELLQPINLSNLNQTNNLIFCTHMKCQFKELHNIEARCWHEKHRGIVQSN